MSKFFHKLTSALSSTSNKISNTIDNIFVKKKLDQDTLNELEELLITSDIGIAVSAHIISELKRQKFDKEITPKEVKQSLSKIILEILSVPENNFHLNESGLTVILMCGVNGNGKTTTIAKLAASYIQDGKKVSVAACDTFRAAAVEQIKAWTDRVGAHLYAGNTNADPASVAYNAVNDALIKNYDILFIDTAGRLHNQQNLMDQLAKIIRVIKKIDETFPHHSLLVIDGTTGQNAIVQAREFQNISNITGLIVTKLDGTAKAGAMVGIVKEFGLPIHFIGTGEKADDLQRFNPKDFSDILVGIKD